LRPASSFLSDRNGAQYCDASVAVVEKKSESRHAKIKRVENKSRVRHSRRTTVSKSISIENQGTGADCVRNQRITSVFNEH
jgi:hypothetical protein